MSEGQGDFSGQLCAVTGAGGFIGSHLVEALLSRDAKVRALTHYNALGAIGHLAALDPAYRDSGQLEIVAGDICDARCVRELIHGAAEEIVCESQRLRPKKSEVLELISDPIHHLIMRGANGPWL